MTCTVVSTCVYGHGNDMMGEAAWIEHENVSLYKLRLEI